MIGATAQEVVQFVTARGLQEDLGVSAVGTGLALLPLGLGMIAGMFLLVAYAWFMAG